MYISPVKLLASPPLNHVISTVGGAFAAAVERSLYFVFAVAFPRPHLFHSQTLSSPNHPISLSLNQIRVAY